MSSLIDPTDKSMAGVILLNNVTEQSWDCCLGNCYRQEKTWSANNIISLIEITALHASLQDSTHLLKSVKLKHLGVFFPPFAWTRQSLLSEGPRGAVKSRALLCLRIGAKIGIGAHAGLISWLISAWMNNKQPWRCNCIWARKRRSINISISYAPMERSGWIRSNEQDTKMFSGHEKAPV